MKLRKRMSVSAIASGIKRKADGNGDESERGVADDDIDSVQDAEEKENDGLFGVELWDTRSQTPSVVVAAVFFGGDRVSPSSLVGRRETEDSSPPAELVSQEEPGAEASTEGMDGGEGVGKGKVDEDGLVVEGEGEIEEEVESEPERRGVVVEGE
jgi:hypothetical protein